MKNVQEIERTWRIDPGMYVCRNKDIPDGYMLVAIPWDSEFSNPESSIYEGELESELDYLEDVLGDKLEKVESLEFTFENTGPAYVAEFASRCGLETLEFLYILPTMDEFIHPGRCICSISKEEFYKTHRAVNKTIYDGLVRDAVTERSGYIPYFSEEDFYWDSIDQLPTDRPVRVGLTLQALFYEKENVLEGCEYECLSFLMDDVRAKNGILYCSAYTSNGKVFSL